MAQLGRKSSLSGNTVHINLLRLVYVLDNDRRVLLKRCLVVLYSREDVCVRLSTLMIVLCVRYGVFKASHSRLQVSEKKKKPSLFICPIRHMFYGLVVKLLTNKNSFSAFQGLDLTSSRMKC